MQILHLDSRSFAIIASDDSSPPHSALRTPFSAFRIEFIRVICAIRGPGFRLSGSIRTLLLRRGEDGFEMGWLLLFGDNADFDLPEAGRFEPAVQIALGKAQPKIAVQFAGLLEFVLQQVEDHDLATRFENSVNGRDGFA